jgi:hypothetical protein
MVHWYPEGHERFRLKKIAQGQNRSGILPDWTEKIGPRRKGNEIKK